MINARTYIVGGAATVHRLNDLTGAWVDVSLTIFFPTISNKIRLYDVETDPNDGDKVFVVGEGDPSDGFFGIYVSFNGGATWQIPGGNYQTNIPGLGTDRKWYEVHALDSNNIFVSGDNGYVAISNDGGLTFTLSTQLPSLPNCVSCPSQIPPVLSVHFLNPLVGIVGLVAHVAKTIDGGLSWSILNSGNVITGGPNGDIFICSGVHMSADQQTLVALSSKNIYQSLDGGVTWNFVYEWAARNGAHLTWINDLELWGFGAKGERIKSLDGGATWIIISAYSPIAPDHYAGHFYLNQNGFYSESQDILSTNNGATSGILSEATGVLISAVWTWYLDTQCYVLTDCEGLITPFIVANDYSLNIGQTVRLCPEDFPVQQKSAIPPSSNYSAPPPPPFPNITECACFTISEAFSCDGAFYLINTGIIFNTCETCPTVCYYLVDCLDPANFIITSDDFASYVGQVVKLSECPNTCWQVLVSPNCNNSVCVSEVIESFINCTACLPPPPEKEPLDLHPRRIKPGYYTPGCSPAYTERINCNFAENIYKQMVAKRYGLDICCDDDFIKWGIKKALLDLKAIYDPELCKCTIQTCCPPTCVQASLQVFNPITCPEPEDATAEITLVLTCPAPDLILSSGIIIQP